MYINCNSGYNTNITIKELVKMSNTKQELIKKVRELVNICVNKNEELYIEMCRCYQANMTKLGTVRLYVPKNMNINELIKLINVCECVIKY